MQGAGGGLVKRSGARDALLRLWAARVVPVELSGARVALVDCGGARDALVGMRACGIGGSVGSSGGSRLEALYPFRKLLTPRWRRWRAYKPPVSGWSVVVSSPPCS